MYGREIWKTLPWPGRCSSLILPVISQVDNMLSYYSTRRLHFYIFLPRKKTLKLWLNHDEKNQKSDKLKLRNIIPNILLVLKKSQGYKKQRNLMNSHRSEETKEIRWLIVMCYPRWDVGWDSWTENTPKLENSIKSKCS